MFWSFSGETKPYDVSLILWNNFSSTSSSGIGPLGFGVTRSYWSTQIFEEKPGFQDCHRLLVGHHPYIDGLSDLGWCLRLVHVLGDF